MKNKKAIIALVVLTVIAILLTACSKKVEKETIDSRNIENVQETENIDNIMETELSKPNTSERYSEDYEVIDYSSEVKEILDNDQYLSGTETNTEGLHKVSFNEMEEAVLSCEKKYWDDSFNEQDFSYQILIYLEYGIMQSCIENDIDAVYSIDAQNGLLNHPDINTSTWLVTANKGPDMEITFNLAEEEIGVVVEMQDVIQDTAQGEE